jgi:hypothetical protein
MCTILLEILGQELTGRMQRKIILRTEQNRTEQNRTEQNRTEQNRTEQNRTEQHGMINSEWENDAQQRE